MTRSNTSCVKYGEDGSDFNIARTSWILTHRLYCLAIAIGCLLLAHVSFSKSVSKRPQNRHQPDDDSEYGDG
jgi:hypothetical protein